MEKKKILLMTTGGTIASMPGGEGLEPQRSEVMEREIDQLRTYYDITVRDVMCLDSSNITPEEWTTIAMEIFRQREGFDGIVVSHGTDTMAYTTSAITFMLPDIDLPVVFTGSQLPLADMLSDGPDNLRTAFAMAASGHPACFWPLTGRSCWAAVRSRSVPPASRPSPASMPATPAPSATGAWWWTRMCFPAPVARQDSAPPSARRSSSSS